MNHRIASAITFASTVAAATVAAAFLTTSAYAETPTIDTTVFVSTRSRADVQAELMGQRGQITAAASEWTMQHNDARPFQSTLTAEQVRSEYKAARNEVRMLTGEDSGSSYFAQMRRSAPSGTIAARLAQ
jgi:hypothetical protein